MSELGEAIRKLGNLEVDYFLIGEVKKVDGRYIDVSPFDGKADVLDVKLHVNDKSSGFLATPKVGASVLIGMVSSTAGYMLMCDNYDTISLKAKEVDLAKQFTDFTKTLKRVLGILKEFQLVTNVGPTIAVMPHLIAKIQKEEQKIDDFEKSITKFLKPM